jgi:hypothetical protein
MSLVLLNHKMVLLVYLAMCILVFIDQQLRFTIHLTS